MFAAALRRAFAARQLGAALLAAPRVAHLAPARTATRHFLAPCRGIGARILGDAAARPALCGAVAPRSPPLLSIVMARGKRIFNQPTRTRAQRSKKKKIKLKSHSGAKKRFKLRADGKFMHAWCGKSHLNTGTHSRMRRRKKGMKLVASLGIQRRLRKLLPYGGI